tara:strand:- start:3133 stop:3333 length:201 start_codon:yes stop_codon:yes gene_type:complete
MTYGFTIQPNSTFNYDVLDEFAHGYDVTYTINSDDTVTFESYVFDDLDEVHDQLEDLIVDTASLLC